MPLNDLEDSPVVVHMNANSFETDCIIAGTHVTEPNDKDCHLRYKPETPTLASKIIRPRIVCYLFYVLIAIKR